MIKIHDVIYNYSSFDNVSLERNTKLKKKTKTKEFEFCVINKQK